MFVLVGFGKFIGLVGFSIVKVMVLMVKLWVMIMICLFGWVCVVVFKNVVICCCMCLKVLLFVVIFM